MTNKQFNDVIREEVLGEADNYVFGRVRVELAKIRAKHGQRTPKGGNGTGLPVDRAISNFARELTEAHRKDGTISWRDIAQEEMLEVFAETDPKLIVEELIQVIAVAFRWIENIERSVP